MDMRDESDEEMLGLGEDERENLLGGLTCTANLLTTICDDWQVAEFIATMISSWMVQGLKSPVYETRSTRLQSMFKFQKEKLI